MPRHHAQEFRKLLDELERNVPADPDAHVTMDNYGTHMTQLIRQWFASVAPVRAFHATSALSINQVESFFAR
jgi:hypothetical protein